MSRVEVNENSFKPFTVAYELCVVILDLAGLTGFWVDVLGLEMR